VTVIIKLPVLALNYLAAIILSPTAGPSMYMVHIIVSKYKDTSKRTLVKELLKEHKHTKALTLDTQRCACVVSWNAQPIPKRSKHWNNSPATTAFARSRTEA